MKKGKQYDFIFAGAGAASLQIVEQLAQSAHFAASSILILEQDNKKSNDRTWCFWEEKSSSKWDAHISKEWEQIAFYSPDLSLKRDLNQLAYKMMRSAPFYASVKKRIAQNNNITLKYEEVISYREQETGVTVTTAKNNYATALFFNSIFDWEIIRQQKRYPVLQQHFVGWFIKTKRPSFDADTATFMDFDIAQKGNTRFMYILPLSAKEALVEYTLFSGEKLNPAAYERELRAYLNKKNIRD